MTKPVGSLLAKSQIKEFVTSAFKNSNQPMKFIALKEYKLASTDYI